MIHVHELYVIGVFLILPALIRSITADLRCQCLICCTIGISLALFALDYAMNVSLKLSALDCAMNVSLKLSALDSHC